MWVGGHFRRITLFEFQQMIDVASAFFTATTIAKAEFRTDMVVASSTTATQPGMVVGATARKPSSYKCSSPSSQHTDHRIILNTAITKYHTACMTLHSFQVA